jgi:hypothetical protein
MYTCTVIKISILGRDYLETTFFKDGVVLDTVRELVDSVKIIEQMNKYTLLKSLSEQKIMALKNI